MTERRRLQAGPESPTIFFPKATGRAGGLAHSSPTSDGRPPLVLESFIFWAETNPHGVALETAGGSLTYAELRRRSAVVAAGLRNAGVRPGATVALVLPNGVEAVTAVLATLWCGAAYVPISPKEPGAAIARLLRDAEAEVVCSNRWWPELADGDLTILDVESLVCSDVEMRPHPVVPGDVAYICYTSGSTGERRGVVVDHENLAYSTAARRKTYPGAARFLLMSPLNFDSSGAGLWGTLTSGGTLIVADDATMADRSLILRSLETSRVTQFLCIPALYDAVLRDIERLVQPALPHLQTVILAGETLPQKLADRHFNTFGARVDLVNEYGPTECTIWASYHRLCPSEQVTIGVAAPGVTIEVVSDELTRVPPGEWGEIVISGPTVARGYHGGSPAERSGFTLLPNGQRGFRTGDLGYVDEAGRLEFGGRIDDQVKVRGHRIATGAVEQALMDLEDVKRAAVLHDAATGELHAYVESERSMTSSAALKGELAAGIPGYMVPATIDILDALPVTSTGKLDRDALRRSSAPAARTVPRTTHEAVTAAWCAVLHCDDVPDDTSFFDAGGNSLRVFDLQDALADMVGSRPDVVDLFAHPTIRSQVQLFDQDVGAATAGARLAAARRQRALRNAAPRPSTDEDS
ncbi:non-ribosomal peptide synthetase [Nocardioides sp.]|uniref:non-ribosomal peptide synthetase n=1 Tax=Nocardioides sp. TaxID=35761 RepID=UPI003517637B